MSQAVIALVMLRLLAQAAAQPEAAPAIDQPLDGASAPAPEMRYAGVVPGPSARNPLPAAPTAPPRLVWTGFKVDAGRPQIFLQTTERVVFDLRPAGGKRAGKHGLSVFLRNCRIHLKNNARRLDTRFFATSVAELSARQRRKDVEIVITLKESVTATPRTEAGPDGTQFLVLEFPASLQVVPLGSAAAAR